MDDGGGGAWCTCEGRDENCACCGAAGNITKRPPLAEIEVADELDLNILHTMESLRDANVILAAAGEDLAYLVSPKATTKYSHRLVARRDLEPLLAQHLPPLFSPPHLLFISAVLQTYSNERCVYDRRQDDSLVDWHILRARRDVWVLVVSIGVTERRIAGLPQACSDALTRRGRRRVVLVRASSLRGSHIGAGRVALPTSACSVLCGPSHLLLVFFAQSSAS